MKITLLRLIWSVVDETLNPPSEETSHREQIQLILQKVNNRVQLSHQDHADVKQYLLERQHLIQELYLEQA
ncbi:MAG: hypothetical protein F6K11_32365 [Leptolyngbya sp. SIO3F4]|nr:hypothetical protein [Leptolyngbya sp. SIO3F4]